jgi:hypothetical protein
MILLIFILVVGAIYLLYAWASDKEAERQQKQNPANVESLEIYTIKKNLFLLFKDYFYSNIKSFKETGDINIIKSRIKEDFPNYGDGIYGIGIISDLSKYRLFYEDYKGVIKLGNTFQIISVAYPNFKEFAAEIYNSGYKMSYIEGGYFSDFGDDIRSKIFCIQLHNARFYYGLSSGGSKINDYVSRHDAVTEDDEMYLFCELKLNTPSPYTYPHFDIISLRKDIPTKEYHDHFSKNLEICKALLPV